MVDISHLFWWLIIAFNWQHNFKIIYVRTASVVATCEFPFFPVFFGNIPSRAIDTLA